MKDRIINILSSKLISKLTETIKENSKFKDELILNHEHKTIANDVKPSINNKNIPISNNANHNDEWLISKHRRHHHETNDMDKLNFNIPQQNPSTW